MLAILARVFEAWLVLTSINYHRDAQVSTLPNHWLGLGLGLGDHALNNMAPGHSYSVSVRSSVLVSFWFLRDP